MATTYRGTHADDSDDEIVWNLSDTRERPLPSSPSYSLVSDLSSDFVILSPPLSPVSHIGPSIPSGSQSKTAARPQRHTPITDVSLAKQVANLHLSGNPKHSTRRKGKPGVVQNGKNQSASTKQHPKKAKKAKPKLGAAPAPSDAYPSPWPSPKAQKTAAPASPNVKKDQRVNDSKATTPSCGDGNKVRPVVTTTSQAPSLYEEASTFISRFLSSPEAKNDSVCRLTLLQSLIIELGLATSNLPASLTAARAFLKARAFLNIREYISVRSQGPDAVRKALYPSKSALIKGFKKNKKNRAPLQWVKDMGLQVLLVGLSH